MAVDKIDPDRSPEFNILILSAVAQELRISPLIKYKESSILLASSSTYAVTHEWKMKPVFFSPHF